MKRIIAVSIILVCLFLFAACGENDSITNDVEDTNMVTINTPYADLKVTSRFYDKTDNKVTSEDPYVLKFSSKDGDDLFSVHFNDKTDLLLCTFQNDGKEVSVYAEMNDLDKNSENYDRNCILQEEINIIRENLIADYSTDSTEGKTDASESVAAFEVNTPVGKVKYPSMWKDKVKVEESGNTVKFSNDGTPLFDLVFEKCDGVLLGTYKDTPVYVVYHDVKTDEQQAMVEDINVILQSLMADKNFKVSYAGKSQ